MRIVENFPPPPPKPPRTFTLEVSEEELRHIELILHNAITRNPDLTFHMLDLVSRTL